MSSTPASSSSASAQRSAAAGASKKGAPKSGARRPAQARSGQARPGAAKRPAGKRPVNAKRPTGSRRQLVRPAPRSKIRRARLVVQKVDTWSVAKLIFLLSIALGIVTVVASVILWLFLQASGAFTGVNQLISSLGTGSTTVDISQMISLGQVALVTTIFAVVNTVVFTLLGMIAAILYNLAAKLVGGVTLTLSDES
ncbi:MULTISPECIES: DUF3566 domain-containing protein [Rothia]|jgi:hypothetical protein|uniref:DUF3566 domain-containing protein n=1 Tax=Rothia mucilaginosa TaxID=43675 RepID=A0A930LYC5_9MICC|nr:MULTISPECIES: DUF3566 domain-containing protein [Rothia]MBF1672859.1 DUF3566 domain-containing protein [Rothia mucilaginosa]MBF1675668.1 DUF3566 domain-containing protein [Rothia sp. (in: high G+C Gram-positive bacteria)]MBS4946296.1 DUF3566 domain-containing protein [Rothia mucilaginosa]OFM96625.1 hypothetical protein HMPREF2630_01520 [Rothia sp. HMSC072B03]OFQ28507.1 hypothetical protein HMPREF2944_00050 [Rothia sp. HMSC072E10]